MSSNLPPIRKIGPAVAPKPKNIKIQAGRVVRINEHEINYKFNNNNNNNNNSIINTNIYRDDDYDDTIPPKLPSQPPPAPPIPKSLLQNKTLNEKTNNIDNNNNELTTTTTEESNKQQYEFDFPSPPSPSIFNTTNSITTPITPLSSTIPINNYNDSSNNNYNNNNNSDFNANKSIENKYKYVDKSIKSDNYLLHENKDISNTTINLSSDSSNRPTITITARGPNSNQHYNIDTNDSITYNIPVQHIQQNKNPTTQFPPRDYQLQSNNNNNTNIVNQTPQTPIATSPPPQPQPTTTTVSAPSSNTKYNNDTSLSSSPLNTSRLSEILSNLNLERIPSKSINNNINNSNNNNNNTDTDELEKAQELLIKNLIGSKDPNFEGICMKCGESIIGLETGLKAMDHIYHIKCFRCISCQSSLKDKHFYAMDNKPYCENCYVRLLEQCSICGKPITDRILRATGKPFHPECFFCTVCKKNLDGVPFTVDASSRIHCIDCFHNKYAPRCHICLLPITPDPGQEETTRIVALDKSFHIHCYKCEDCGISLASTSDKSSGCYPLDDHIYCKSCNVQRIRNIKIISPTPTSNLYTPRSTDL